MSDKPDDIGFIGDEINDDLTDTHYRDAAKALIGVAVDHEPDDEELFYCSLNLLSMLGIVK